MRKRRSFTKEFKTEAVQLALKRGNVAGTAREIEISDTCLDRWVKQMKNNAHNPFPGNGNPADKDANHMAREISRLKEEKEILSDCTWCLQDPRKSRFQFIQRHLGKYRVTTMCKVLQVSCSGFYTWSNRQTSIRCIQDE